MLVDIGPYKDDGTQEVAVHVDDHDMWSTYITIAQLVVPLLEAFRAGKGGADKSVWGCCFDNNADRDFTRARARQHAILDKMLYAFRAYLADGSRAAEDPRAQEGLALFAKHFPNLWT